MHTDHRRELKTLADKFRSKTVLVVGDLMLDRYLWGSVSRISPEAPVPVVELSGETTRLGGAANVAGNIASFGARARLVGVVGDDEPGKKILSELEKLSISRQAVLVDSRRPTTVKTRIIAHSQQVVRTDMESRADLASPLEDGLARAVAENLDGADAVVVSDYGKGVLTDRVLKFVTAEAKKTRVPVCVDPKETRLLSYSGVTVITPNQHEAGFAYGRRIVDESTLLEVGWGLSRKLGCDAVLITRGEKGMSLFERDGVHTHFPTVAREVFDVTGAGDTVVSAFALSLAAGANLKQAASISNHAAGIVIRELGTATTNVAELLGSFDANSEWAGW
jgi:D-beta-D-heptose 7-phosphate kinase/D-beta-D-heptose 1-phosphate adenosyltransferase